MHQICLGDHFAFDILKDLDKIVDQIHDEITNERTISRLATVVIEYLMKYKELTHDDAYKYVKSSRDCINPNFGFVEQLKKYRT